MANAPGDTPYRRSKIGDCTCGYGLPDLLVGATSSPPVIVMVCPECGEQWELGLTEATPESMAAALDLDEKKEPS
ncbi:MAG TPA: hypothetical protein VK550_12195 [Polyangiaceae bacterium]|nr:hypothetical protein [Polyangiaceae bacterium]